MLLTDENYYSPEANYEYMSVSQYKDFAGSYGRIPCEAKALAHLKGEWEDEPSTALMVGSYVDRYFEGTLDRFKEEHPEIFTKKGDLRAEYKQADKMIARAERDPLFMGYMSGQKQVIMTAELFGVQWKCKLDSYIEHKAIVDLKTLKSITKLEYVPDIGYLDFVRYWGYDIQGAIYQEIVYQNTGERLPFFIAAITKEDHPNIEVIYVDDSYLQEALNGVRSGIQHVLDVKSGRVEPHRCGMCDYCKDTKVLVQPAEIDKLIDGVR